MQREAVKVSLWDVVKAFWSGAKPQKGIMFLTFFISFYASALGVIGPVIYKKFFDVLTSGNSADEIYPTLIYLLVVVLVVHLVVTLSNRVNLFILNDFESKTMARLKQNAFQHLMHHSYSFFANSFAGSLVQKVGRFSRSFERLYDTLIFNIVPLATHVTGVLIVVWFQKPLLAKILMGWILGVMIFSLLFSRWKVKYDLASAKADSATTAVLADAIGNQNTITLFNNFPHEFSLFKKTTNDQARAQRFTWNLSNAIDAVQGVFIVIVEFLVFYYAVRYWRQGVITVGTFFLLQAYILGLAHRLWDLGRIIRNFYEAFADSKEMVDIMHREHDIKNLPGASELKVKVGEISFENVNFHFNETRSVLESFSLLVGGGEKVALIGPSGAGKSTIVKTLLRMYDLSSGAIRIDGQDIKMVTQESLRQMIGLVPQEPALFHRSLMENIRYGRPDATDEEVLRAAKLAHCDEFIEDLPLKYETLVGERGIKLSGGERQRVAIARAILKNAPILILDEATSSLDSHSESLIQDALETLMKGKTSIVIAHRLSTIRKMDRIVVLENGKVIEDGDHASLLAKDSGLYKKLWNLQAGGFLTA